MCIASGLGAKLKSAEDYFAEGNAKYVVETHVAGMAGIERVCTAANVRVREIGRTTPDPILQISRLDGRSEAFDLHVGVDELTKTWRGTLDW
jgi:hypothetical protein